MKKIAIIGPESTGKSELCSQLAAHFKTVWCPEFARDYLLKNGKDYNYEDLLTIAKGQVRREDEYIQKAKGRDFIFIDTEMYVMKVWSEFVFQKCHRYILEQIIERKYDLYLLCNTDLPWEPDELREYPDLESRKKLFRIYKDIMVNQRTPWFEVSGVGNDRVKKAIATILNIETK